jgi:hypothetical protein
VFALKPLNNGLHVQKATALPQQTQLQDLLRLARDAAPALHDAKAAARA